MSCVSPNKFTNYFPNGSGRDMYIYTNNGGYFEKLLTDSPRESPFIRKKITLPALPSKKIHYNPDGTGRDTYIK